MADSPITPAKDPSSDADLSSMLASVLSNYMKKRVDGMLPATVISYNRRTNRATVAPSVAMLMSNGERLPRASLANIPVLSLGGGGFNITFPLVPGSTGWIEASDRDISLWLQSGGKGSAPPNTERIHSFSDGRFIPDALNDFTLPATADGALCIQHRSGNTAIVMTPTGIIVHGRTTFMNGVDITRGLTVDGIQFGTHKHTNVTTGSGTSGGPSN